MSANDEVVCMGCHWLGTVRDCNAKPHDLICCPQCGEPMRGIISHRAKPTLSDAGRREINRRLVYRKDA